MLALECGAYSNADAEREVNEEIDRFDAYFRTLQADRTGLTGPERAAIKTFCAYLLGIGPNNPRAASPEGKTDAEENRR